MDPPADPPTVAQRILPQYSMATGLKVVTGCCILFSLTAWNPVLGWMLSTPIVGAWWSYSAVRAGRRRLAYYLAAWPMGGLVFVVGFLPLASFSLMSFEPPKDRVFPQLVIMCLAWMVTVAILRKRIRKPGRGVVVLAGILSVYVAAAMFILVGFVYGAIVELMFSKGPHDAMVVVPIFGVLLSAIWATILMPVAGPIGVCFCAILRRVDPVNTETASSLYQAN